MKKLLTLSLFIIAILSCRSNENASETSPPKRPKAKQQKLNSTQIARIAAAQKLGELFTPARTVHLETVDDGLIGEIQSLYFVQEQNKFVILDTYVSNAVFIFNADGRFERRISQKGSGPREYGQLRAVACKDSIVAIFSIFPAKLLLYTLNGAFVDEINFDQKGWLFNPNGMVFSGNDLYLYPKNTFRRKAPDGKEYQVFRLRNARTFDKAFGAPEATYDWGEGAITSHGDVVLYPGVFDGNIYQINTATDELSVLGSVGMLFDGSKLGEGDLQQNLMKYMNEMDSALQIGVLKNLIFLHRNRFTTVMDLTGRIINRNLLSVLDAGDDFASFASRLRFFYYKDGIMIAANLKSRIKEDSVPNPSILFFELNIH